MKVHVLQDMEWEVVVEGVKRKMIYGEKVMLAQFHLDKGTIVPMHSHPNEQISHITQGAIKFWIDGKEVIVRSGEVLLIPADVPHKALAVEDTMALDSFSPIRQDWLNGTATYFTREDSEG